MPNTINTRPGQTKVKQFVRSLPQRRLSEEMNMTNCTHLPQISIYAMCSTIIESWHYLLVLDPLPPPGVITATQTFLKGNV